ncbi:MAG: hypothetical protein JNN20_15120 [Betaproteobacteria bacterium]|nr:hypothetical protein [Betaproteobacteria bacterium]
MTEAGTNTDANAFSGTGRTTQQLLDQIGASWMSQAIGVAAELQLADRLSAGPRSVPQLARDAGCNEDALRRLLHALTSLEIFKELEDGRFALDDAGRHLCGDAPQSLRHWAIWCAHYHWPIWADLLDSVRTGRSARQLKGVDAGASGYAHIERDPHGAAVFNQAMVEITGLIAAGLVSACEWEQVKHVVDVGGGYGGVIAALLAAQPAMRGTLFDLPHAMEGAAAHLARAGVDARCALVSGSFFEAVPANGDVYLMKSILHNWDDERCKEILVQCRRAMRSDAKLLLVERVMPARLGTALSDRAIARSDLNMLVSLTGHERTTDELRHLLDAAGFSLNELRPVWREFSVLEAVPR